MADDDERLNARSGPSREELPASQYRSLVEHSPVLIWRSNTSGACDYFNETWLQFTGHTLQEELGDGWASGVHPDDLERCLAIYRSHFERRAPFEMEYRLRRHDGAYRWIFDRGVPFYDDDGSFSGFIGSCVDVQERRELDEAKARFLAMMAHEQRTPLTAMRTFLEVVRRRMANGKPLDETALSRLQGQIEQLTRLVQTLSDTARLDAGLGLRLQMEPLDVAEVLRESAHACQASLAPRGEPGRRHELVLELAAPLPADGDRDRLGQAFRALLDNAVKFSPKGGRVLVRAQAEGDRYKISIQDTGVGIPPDERLRVGRRFFRASNAQRERFPGIGVGFALVKEIVERHGGRVDVDSTLGEGTTVTVLLPGRAPEPA